MLTSISIPLRLFMLREDSIKDFYVQRGLYSDYNITPTSTSAKFNMGSKKDRTIIQIFPGWYEHAVDGEYHCFDNLEIMELAYKYVALRRSICTPSEQSCLILINRINSFCYYKPRHILVGAYYGLYQLKRSKELHLYTTEKTIICLMFNGKNVIIR